MSTIEPRKIFKVIQIYDHFVNNEIDCGFFQKKNSADKKLIELQNKHCNSLFEVIEVKLED